MQHQQPKSIRRLLEDCIAFPQTATTEKPQISTLHLMSGRDKIGQPLSLEFDKSDNKTMLLFQIYNDNGREATKHLLYVDIAHIEAVTVWDAVKPPTPMTTRWELKQKAHADSVLLTEGFQSDIKYDIDFTSFNDSEINFGNLKELLNQMTRFLQDYLSNYDKLAIDAVRSKVSTIKIAASDAFSVDLKDKNVTIFLETNKGILQSYVFDFVSSAFEKVL
jgi:hypothetical protein